ncbi:MAG: 3'(2'),5'-bisphosphate nucleotidase CysQ [Acidiferrobacterales bacterium]
MIPPDHQSSEIDALVEIARAAGRSILHIYERDFHVDSKNDGSPLTEADRAANGLIVQRLAELAPERPVLSEEMESVTYSERVAWRRFWLVDPLDGTREFVKRNGEFTVNIALVEDGRPVLGVVHVPVTDVTYVGCRGAGAFRQEAGGVRLEIRARSYRGGRATVVASRSHAGDKLGEFLARLEAREGGYDTASLGSSLKICLVAEGHADIYPRLGPTSEWDTAAAHCVLEAAGGRLTDLHGRPLAYNKESLLNPWFLASGEGNYDWTALVNDDG